MRAAIDLVQRDSAVGPVPATADPLAPELDQTQGAETPGNNPTNQRRATRRSKSKE